MVNRRTIPSSSQIFEAEKILRSDAAPSVRWAAASILLPEIELEELEDEQSEDQAQDPVALRGYLTQVGDILVDVLRKEKDEFVTKNILMYFARHKDPQVKDLLLSLANERPDLRDRIERLDTPEE